MKKAYYFGREYRQFKIDDYVTYITFYGAGEQTCILYPTFSHILTRTVEEFYHSTKITAGVLMNYKSYVRFLKKCENITVVINTKDSKFDAKLIDNILKATKDDIARVGYGDSFANNLINSMKYIYISFNEYTNEYIKYDPNDILYKNACYGYFASSLDYRKSRGVAHVDSSLLNPPGPGVHRWIDIMIKEWEDYVKERYKNKQTFKIIDDPRDLKHRINSAMYELLVEKSEDCVGIEIIKDKPAPFKYFFDGIFTIFRFKPVDHQ